MGLYSARMIHHYKDILQLTKDELNIFDFGNKDILCSQLFCDRSYRLCNDLIYCSGEYYRLERYNDDNDKMKFYYLDYKDDLSSKYVEIDFYKWTKIDTRYTGVATSECINNAFKIILSRLKRRLPPFAIVYKDSGFHIFKKGNDYFLEVDFCGMMDPSRAFDSFKPFLSTPDGRVYCRNCGWLHMPNI